MGSRREGHIASLRRDGMIDRKDLPPNWTCTGCARLDLASDPDAPTCRAFKRGIPWIVLTGQNDHTTHIPGDNGLQRLPLEPPGGA